MNIKANGEEIQIPEAISITELLKIRKVQMPDMVSVEVNGEILRRETFDTTLLKAGDVVEFLYFMGGGSK
jgi:sulfur carrier protein